MENKKIKNTLSDAVAETLYINVKMKCMQTKAQKPFFKDPFACELLEKIDYDFNKYKKSPNAGIVSLGVTIRANYFDEVTAAFIEQNNQPVVVVVGCGLDTRYQRLGKKITDKAVFYEVDLPEVMEMRAQLLPPAKNDIYIKASMFETGWMDRIGAQHPGADILFVIEGVLMYFESRRVREVLLNLVKRFRNSRLIFDVVSSWTCRMSAKRATPINKIEAPQFRFECDDDRLMESWSPALQLVSSNAYAVSPLYKRAGFLMYWIIKTVPMIKKSSRILLYRNNEGLMTEKIITGT